MSNESEGLRKVAEHIFRVQDYMGRCVSIISGRSVVHDISKYSQEELPLIVNKSKLDRLDIKSQEYKDALAEMDSAIQHHYKANKHHPEFHDDGVLGMSLFDLLEMFCDWKAAGEMSGNTIEDSISYGKDRFDIPDSIVKILENTAVELGFTQNSN